MNFDQEGRVISCFIPPRDPEGRVLSYHEYRERQGDPIGVEEERLLEEIRTTRTALYARWPGPPWPPTAEYVPLWRLERQLRALREPVGRQAWRTRREREGKPVTAEQEKLRDQWFYLEMTHSLPWTHEELVRSNDLWDRLWK